MAKGVTVAGSMPRRVWEGFQYVRGHGILPGLFILDIGMTVFTFYRDLLPALANGLFGGVDIHGAAAYVVAAGVLAVANTVLKPVLAVLTLPLILVTFGLFYLAINIAMVALAAAIAPDFTVQGFWTYVGIVAILWLVNWSVTAFIDRTVGLGARSA